LFDQEVHQYSLSLTSFDYYDVNHVLISDEVEFKKRHLEKN